MYFTTKSTTVAFFIAIQVTIKSLMIDTTLFVKVNEGKFKMIEPPKFYQFHIWMVNITELLMKVPLMEHSHERRVVEVFSSFS